MCAGVAQCGDGSRVSAARRESIARRASLLVLCLVAVANAQTHAAGTTDPAEALAQRARFQAECQRLRADGKLTEAVAAAEGMLAIERKLEGDHLDEILGSLQWIAEVEAEREHFQRVIEIRQEVLERLRNVRGAGHWTTVVARLALQETKSFAQLSPRQRERLAEADGLIPRAKQLSAARRYGEAVDLASRVLAIRKDVLGPRNTDTMKSMIDVAALLQAKGDYAGARPLFEETLAIRKEVLGPRHPHTATSMNYLATLFQATGNYARARPLFEEALAIRKEALGPRHPSTARSMNDLATLLHDKGDYAAARPLLEEALAIGKEVLGPKHPNTVASMNNLANLLIEQGDYARATSLTEQALAISKDVLGPKHPFTAHSMINLALLLQARADYVGARPLFEEALAIRKEVLGPKHPDTAVSMTALGCLLYDLGDYARARPLFEEALAISKEVKGPRHPDTADVINELACLLVKQNNYAGARPLFEEALAICKEKRGPKHVATARCMNGLASLLQVQRDYAGARSVFEQSLAILQEVEGPRHPNTLTAMNNLANLLLDHRDYDRARPLLEQSLAICKEVQGPRHPETATKLLNLSGLLYLQGKNDEASHLEENAVEIVQQNLELAAATQSERQQMLMTISLRIHLDMLLSEASGTSMPVGRLYGYVLASKGAVTERQIRSREWHRRLKPGAVGADDYTELRSIVQRLANLALNSPGLNSSQARSEEMASLTTRKDQLEARLAAANPDFRALRASLRPTPEHIQKLLPQSSALVDFWAYSHAGSDSNGSRAFKQEIHLLAFVVRADRPVTMIRLGPIEPILRTVQTWRGWILNTERVQGDDPGRRLKDLVWTPLEPHLDGVGTILISPDLPLDRMPLGALPGKKPGTYLIEEHAIALVPVPRLLASARGAELGSDGSSRRNELNRSLLAIGDVDYGAEPGWPAASGTFRSAAVRSRDGLFNVEELKATRAEIEAISSSFEKHFRPARPDILAGAAATEEAFRQAAPKHRYLHLATHGYFAPPQLRSALAPSNANANPLALDPLGGAGLVGYNPGLLSGLMLAGANRHGSDPGKDDGILTALEVAELDLSGVELAVLSACETGLGEVVVGGEGLLGLQRAFQVAGAHSVVASLWSVGDDTTRDLMTRFYCNLWQKRLTPIEALRGAQLEMIKEIRHGKTENRGLNPDQRDEDRWRASPFFWAAFVVSTDET